MRCNGPSPIRIPMKIEDKRERFIRSVIFPDGFFDSLRITMQYFAGRAECNNVYWNYTGIRNSGATASIFDQVYFISIHMLLPNSFRYSCENSARLPCRRNILLESKVLDMTIYYFCINVLQNRILKLMATLYLNYRIQRDSSRRNKDSVMDEKCLRMLLSLILIIQSYITQVYNSDSDFTDI